jgi:hypothetical protein
VSDSLGNTGATIDPSDALRGCIIPHSHSFERPFVEVTRAKRLPLQGRMSPGACTATYHNAPTAAGRSLAS